MRRFLVMLILAAALAGCAGAAPAPASEPQTAPTVLTLPPETCAPTQAPIPMELTMAPLPPQSILLEPAAPGEREERCDSAVVDYSNTADGYVMVRFTAETDKRLKVQVKGPTTTYTYNLPQGEWTVFPLSDGNGNYQVGVYQNIQSTKYAMVMTARFDAELADEFAPFLRPNQYVNYLDAPDTLAQGAVLCQNLTDPLDKVAAVYDYVVESLSYDYELAATVKSGYLPELDKVLERKKGICFDYAALMTAMLRSQDVPCKLVVGYAGSAYHAWISVWTEDQGWIDGVIFFDGKLWKRMDPTFASSSQRSPEIMKFIENNGNYTVKYLY